MKNQCKKCKKLLLIADVPMGFKGLFLPSDLCWKCQMIEVSKMESTL